ncbi:hypothetical protein PO124_05900 [Bacillus licheniformis]|nr:hypothetical protein [Bacillus licheniformis]
MKEKSLSAPLITKTGSFSHPSLQLDIKRAKYTVPRSKSRCGRC